MKSSSHPIQEIMANHQLRKAFIAKQTIEDDLNQNLHKKYSLKNNIIKNNKLYQERVILSQRKILQKQNSLLSKAKQIIQLKQKKARSIKAYSLIDKSKKIQAQLTKWTKIVEANIEQHQSRVKDQIKLTKDNNQLSQSSSSKDEQINELLQNFMQKRLQKSKQYSSRQIKAQSRVHNPQSSQQNLQIKNRYISLTVNRRPYQNTSRLSNQSIQDKKRKLQQSQIQKSLINIIGKQQKINQARYMKLYLQQRTKKSKQSKSKFYEQIRQNNLSQIKVQTEQRNIYLDQKFTNSRNRVRNIKRSLPQINAISKNLPTNTANHDSKKNWDQMYTAFKYTQPLKQKFNQKNLLLEECKNVQNFIRKNKIV